MTDNRMKLPDSKEELKALFAHFIEASQSMEQQHGRLTQEVATLRETLAAKDRLLERKSRLEDLGRMAAGVAHEIRNPLGGIRLYTDLLMRRLNGDDFSWHHETLGKVRQQIVQLERIVSDMLEFTREIVIRPREIHPADVMRAALELAQGHASAERYHVDAQMAPATLCADPSQLQKVYLNTILNAYQAMEDGGELVVRGRELVDKQVYVTTICDTGQGIPEDKLDSIFHPFMTTKAEGTGLGLAIAHRVMDEHDGRIEVRNNKERGVTVILTLPLAAKRIPVAR